MGPLVSVVVLAALSSSGDQRQRRSNDEGGPMRVSQLEATIPIANFLDSGISWQSESAPSRLACGKNPYLG